MAWKTSQSTRAEICHHSHVTVPGTEMFLIVMVIRLVLSDYVRLSSIRDRIS